ncbi:MAG TPA: 3-oxoacyl-ACP reductase family protein [Polyangiaceae bacterium]|nr:3-oxoacyl-ACP reductase family protein [Polyangiaceae bacterium]
MFDLSGKVAVVTGGSRGIGRAATQALASRGATVVFSYVSGEEAARETADLVQKAGGKAEAVRCDVSNFAEAEAFVDAAAKRLGRLDILVANAGVSIDGLLLRVKEEDLDRTFAVNVKGAIACAKASLKPMMRAKSGRILFISSVVGEMGNAGQVAYSASKGALVAVTKSLAREYASRSITVNAITPGYVDTDMTRALTEEQRQAMLGVVPLGRAASAMEIAAAIAYLASDEAGYITGHTLRINGGMYM